MIGPLRVLIWIALLISASLPLGGCPYAVYRDQPEWFFPAKEGLYDRQVVETPTPADDHSVSLDVVGVRTVESGAYVDVMFSGSKAETVSQEWSAQFRPDPPREYPNGYFVFFVSDTSTPVSLARPQSTFHSMTIVPPFALVNAMGPSVYPTRIGGLPAKWLVGLPVRVEGGLPPGTYRVMVGDATRQIKTPDARATPSWTANEFVVTTTADSQNRSRSENRNGIPNADTLKLSSP